MDRVGRRRHEMVRRAEAASGYKEGHWRVGPPGPDAKMVMVEVSFYPRTRWWVTDVDARRAPWRGLPDTRRRLTPEVWATLEEWL